jgi:hypothetical protein
MFATTLENVSTSVRIHTGTLTTFFARALKMRMISCVNSICKTSVSECFDHVGTLLCVQCSVI